MIFLQTPSPSPADAKEEITSAWDRTLNLYQDTINRLPSIILAIVVFTVFFLLARGINLAIRSLTRLRRNARSLGMVLGRLAQGTIILIGAFVALTIVIPSFKIGDLVNLLGISGVAIGFAFRDILQNFLSGILILLTEPFEINDQKTVTGRDGQLTEK
mgnify:CR=1 FL=1